MKRNTARTLALVSRVARVRELQARQQLAVALGNERDRQQCVEQAGHRIEGVMGALRRIRAEPRMDAARLALFNQLSSHADQMLADEEATLAEARKIRDTEAEIVVQRSRYRDRAEQLHGTAVGEAQREIEERQKDLAMETWMILQTKREPA